jgi:hypothetical protein
MGRSVIVVDPEDQKNFAASLDAHALDKCRNMHA